jgi:glutamate formiminotransferase
MKTKTHAKLNISLPLELHAWCVQKQKEEQRRSPLAQVRLSRIIAKAVEEMMDEEIKRTRFLNDEGKSDSQPHSGPKTMNPRKTSVGGFKTPKIVKYQKGKRAS